MKTLRILFAIVAASLAIFSCTKPEQEVSVSAVTLDTNILNLDEEESYQLTATVSPADAKDKKVTWSSSDASVATVTSSGLVLAISEGKATITAEAGGKSGKCEVTVTAKFIAVTAIIISKTSARVVKGESTTLSATVLPENATVKTVYWTSSDESVAKVQDGKVDALKVGTAVITASAGGFDQSCTVTVEPCEVTSVELDKTSATLRVNGEVTLTATVKPEQAEEKTVTWTSSDGSVATVTEGRVHAVSLGEAVITAKAGGKSAQCKITVEPTPVESIELDKTSITLRATQTATITATVKPDDATVKTVSWSSSDASVASVENGVITALKVGTATITAKSGEKTATCSVTVEATPVESISLSKSSIVIVAGEVFTLKATVLPDTATEKTVTWTSSDESIATVAGGIVTGVKTGKAIITAKAGDKTATCEVEVQAAIESVTLDKESLTLAVGKTYTLTATVKPEEASTRTLRWSSSDSSVASVDENGTVTAVAKGQATISVKAGDKSAACAVTVKENTGGNEGFGDDEYDW